VETKYGMHVYEYTISSYFRALVGKIFKILPMYEEDNATLSVYLRSLMLEMAGGSKFIDDKDILELIVNLEGMLFVKDHKELRSQVFKCTNICTQLANKYDGKEE